MRYTTKEFLTNGQNEYGSICCEIETPRVKDIRSYTIDKGGNIFASARISDCGGAITLDFNADGQRQYEKRCEKLDKLIKDLQAMRHQYTAMWENHVRDCEFKQSEIEKEKQQW